MFVLNLFVILQTAATPQNVIFSIFGTILTLFNRMLRVMVGSFPLSLRKFAVPEVSEKHVKLPLTVSHLEQRYRVVVAQAVGA